MGPNVAVPSTRAGGAVDEPLASTSTFTLGYDLRKSSAHSVMRLFMVSDPTLLILPATPVATLYGKSLESTVRTLAKATPAAIDASAATDSNIFTEWLRIMD